MSTITIRGVPITFPYEPYEIQRIYMEKVIECLQNETNGVLESPTGTGKTLCLLCSSLAWLTAKKAQLQAQHQTAHQIPKLEDTDDEFLQLLQEHINSKVGSSSNNSGRTFMSVPTIIYASRTHSQLSQAMQELKKTSYVHLKATIVGSREQLCIHQDVIKEENNSMKIHLCKSKVDTKSCHFYNRVEKMKTQIIHETNVIDVEDIVSMGQKHKFCPYFMAKELKQHADIIFLPYNYLLDPISRKSLGIELSNSIIILDEAHNVERICEDAASIQLSSSDISLCLAEVTDVMKAMTDCPVSFNSNDTQKDFTAEELCYLKQILLDFEKTIDSLKITQPEGCTYEGDYIFEILRSSGICSENYASVLLLIDKVVQFLSTANSEGPFQRRGTGLELFVSLARTVAESASAEFVTKIKKCFKIHIVEEDVNKKTSDWQSKTTTTTRSSNRIFSFWCFSPGFGMNMLMQKGVKSIILTSGTLAPLKPLITEMELNIQVQLENPHIVDSNQIFIKIINKGPDGIELNSNYQNRNNPSYISSLGRTIVNLVRIIPHGVLIFFPAYPVMKKCQQQWQEEGIWTNISQIKAIYTEPKQKEAFNTAMNEYYARIKNPQYKGAIFMGVCRGKLSEGLDFVDMNGRAVIITGLPYAPFKDPRIVLKRQYLDKCKAQDNAFVSGQEWYSLEATRAVNQAVGRVIRHRYDYGAIILLDCRFENFRIKSQMSLWLRDHIKVANTFGQVIKDLRGFFRNAEINLPSSNDQQLKILQTSNNEFPEKENSQTHKHKANFNFSTTSSNSDINKTLQSNENSDNVGGSKKRKRIVIVNQTNESQTNAVPETEPQEYIAMVKKSLKPDDFKIFVNTLSIYRSNTNFYEFVENLDRIFLMQHGVRFLIRGLTPYIKTNHKTDFEKYLERRM